jgi:hypothetical protein
MTMNMNKTLLLDIDGVLVRDRVLLDHVKNNIVSYVHKKVPSHKNPYNLNNMLYKIYGHTAKGLKKVYKLDTSDFDTEVYDIHVLEHLYDFLETREFKNDSEIVRHVLDIGFDVEFLSNSPLVWSEPVKYAIDRFRIKNKGAYEKPDFDTYLKFDPSREYIFVDDSINNLLPTLSLDNWNQIHFSPTKKSHFIDTVSSMDELLKKIQPRSDRPATSSSDTR